MRKETILVIVFLLLTIGGASAIWIVAFPNFKPVVFPQVTSGSVDIGPMHHKRDLTQQEVAQINTWFSHHTKGWGPLVRTPPSTGDSHIFLFGKDGKEVLMMTLWTGISAADWDRVAFIESPDESYLRTEDFQPEDFEPLRMIVDQYPYQRSAYP